MRGSPWKRFFIVGGAGFIGSHFTDYLLGDPAVQRVTLYDNFSSGREWHYEHLLGDARLKIVRGEVADLPALQAAMEGHEVVVHLASNPDIARAATEPTIDFSEGTALTQNVLEATRLTTAKRILYASGSGIYGDLGELEVVEDHGPLLPVSTYGASKLAGEALICSYCHMFDLSGCVFRFGNVVGPRQTHGVGYDFVRRLLVDSSVLPILGDGSQSKSYIHVKDVIAAVFVADAHLTSGFAVYNVATGDYITVTEIADLVLDCMRLPRGGTKYQFSGGKRGWKGDVPVVRLNTERIRALGWANSLSTREALRESILAMISDAKDRRR